MACQRKLISSNGTTRLQAMSTEIIYLTNSQGNTKMPFMTNGKRDYKKELSWEHTKKKTRVKDRAARNKARAMVAKKNGTKATKLKGDVGHRKAISKGGKSVLANLFVQNPGENRSFKRNAKGAMVSETSTKERKKR